MRSCRGSSPSMHAAIVARASATETMPGAMSDWTGSVVLANIRPLEKRLNGGVIHVVCGQYQSVEIIVGWFVSASRAFCDRCKQAHGARPVVRNRQSRDRPAEVPVVTAARRLGNRGEPRGGDPRIQNRSECECVGDVGARHGITRIERNRRITDVQ